MRTWLLAITFDLLATTLVASPGYSSALLHVYRSLSGVCCGYAVVGTRWFGLLIMRH